MGSGMGLAMRLPVAFESQHDNRGGQGYRECFSSSCAMLARYWGKVLNDDSYNAVRRIYGDTTTAHSQIQALRVLGLQAHFWTNGTRVDLIRELQGGRPVAVGWLHRGPAHRPTGGHWSVLVGIDNEHRFLMHDPAGEPLLLSGGHIRGSNGAYVSGSWKNWLPRWEVEGPRSGWYVTARG